VKIFRLLFFSFLVLFLLVTGISFLFHRIYGFQKPSILQQRQILFSASLMNPAGGKIGFRGWSLQNCFMKQE
jgi:hypothetical protein